MFNNTYWGSEMLSLETVFLALAIIFVSLALRDYLKDEGKLTPARNTWLMIAMIFSAVSVLQYVFNRLL